MAIKITDRTTASHLHECSRWLPIHRFSLPQVLHEGTLGWEYKRGAKHRLEEKTERGGHDVQAWWWREWSHINSRSGNGHDIETDSEAGMTILCEETCRQMAEIHDTGNVAGLPAAPIGWRMKRPSSTHCDTGIICNYKDFPTLCLPGIRSSKPELKIEPQRDSPNCWRGKSCCKCHTASQPIKHT